MFPTYSFDRALPALTLEAALRLLQSHYGLQAFSVLDVLNATHRCKLDRDDNSMYCSLLSFTYDSKEAGGQSRGLPSKGKKGKKSQRGRGLEEPLLVVRGGDDDDGWGSGGAASHNSRAKHSHGTLHDLLHLGLQTGMVGQ